jgi:S-ribosylhomocysteine lyase LuxS involved in autoinducer biosynthesis
MGRDVAWMGEGRGMYMVLVGKPEEKRSIWRPRHRWQDNIEMVLQEVGCGDMDWIELAQDTQVAGTRECGNENSGSIKCGRIS